MVMITKTKQQMIREVARQAGIALAAAETAVNAVKECMIGTLMGLGRFQMADVGVFTLVQRAPREGRMIRDGSPIHIPGRKAVRFKEAASLKRRVNG
jgi:DNA-binding protein HU-beta